MQAEQPQPLRLLSDFAVVSTTNKKGLRRAKKGVVLVDGSGKEAFEQQDTSFAQYPFGRTRGLRCLPCSTAMQERSALLQPLTSSLAISASVYEQPLRLAE